MFLHISRREGFLLRARPELSTVRGETPSRRNSPTGVVNFRYDLTNQRYELFDPLFRFR